MMLLDIIVLRSKGPLTFSQTKWNTHFQENQSNLSKQLSKTHRGLLQINNVKQRERQL